MIRVRHPAIQGVMQMMAQSSAPFSDITIGYAARREAMDAMGEGFPLADGVALAQISLGGRPTARYAPVEPKLGSAILYLHGGGYCAGSPKSHRGICAALAQRAGVNLFALSYRLAPEHPFPAGIIDAVNAYMSLRSQGYEHIALAGDSAGGGLALSTALKLREQGAPKPAGLYLISPWADLTLTAPAVLTRAAVDPVLTREGLTQMAKDYLAGADARHPLASPAYADLSGLSAMFIQVGSDEILLHDAAAIHAAARGHEVEATLEVHPKMIHDFPLFFPLVPEADQALHTAAGWLKARL